MSLDASPVPRSGARILVDQLRLHGVDAVACVPGESYLGVLDALLDAPGIRVTMCRHEAAAANMADADPDRVLGELLGTLPIREGGDDEQGFRHRATISESPPLKAR